MRESIILMTEYSPRMQLKIRQGDTNRFWTFEIEPTKENNQTFKFSFFDHKNLLCCGDVFESQHNGFKALCELATKFAYPFEEENKQWFEEGTIELQLWADGSAHYLASMMRSYGLI